MNLSEMRLVLRTRGFREVSEAQVAEVFVVLELTGTTHEVDGADVIGVYTTREIADEVAAEHKWREVIPVTLDAR